jgi:[acyl-carrier-protein] S-malonyltransferase
VLGTPEVGDVEVGVGVLLGHVGENEVRTPFAGQVVGFLAHAGERVVTGQPLAWLRVSTAGT